MFGWVISACFDLFSSHKILFILPIEYYSFYQKKKRKFTFFFVLHVKSYLQIDTDPLDSIISYMPAAFPDVL
jgi:hypothetical protein